MLLNFWHIIITLLLTLFLFCKSTDAVKNVFFFMLVSLQIFLILIFISQHYFFSFLILIIYIGAIAVLFLFVVLSIGNSKLAYTLSGYSAFVNFIKSTHFFKLLSFGLFLAFFFSIFLYFLFFFITLVYNQTENLFWESNIFKNKYDYFLSLKYSSSYTSFSVLNENVIPLHNNNIFLLENYDNTFYKYLISNMLVQDFFGFWLNNSNNFYPSGWGHCLFFRDAHILYICGFILLATTIGLISLITERRKYDFLK